GAADRRVDIKLREADPLGCEAVDVGRLDARVAVAAQIAVAHVVDEDKEEVGARLERRGEKQKRQGDEDPHGGNEDTGLTGDRPYNPVTPPPSRMTAGADARV